jgi:uncharacterized delta-60 repeat protein
MREFLDYALQHLLMQATLGKLRKRARLLRRVFLLTLLLTSGAAYAGAADGDLDRSYGNDGISILRVDGRTAYSVGKPILLEDGKMLLGGVSNFLPMQNVGSSIILRVNPDGSLDQTFGDNGKIINTTLVNLVGLTRLADGKIVFAGSCLNGSELRLAATRYNADRSLDTNFGTNGYAIGTAGVAKAFTVQPDGKIIVAGYATTGTAASDDFLLVRFDADGKTDASFGAGGTAQTDFYGGTDRVSGIAVQAGGHIVAAGFATVPNRIAGTETRVDFALAGYNSNGTLDPSFGTDGLSTTRFSRQNLAQVQNLAAQADGKVVVVGGYTPSGEGMAMARYERDGKLDPTFDEDGKAVMDYPGLTSPVIFRAVTVERGGKMLSVAAPTETAAQRDFFLLARCTRFGSVDRTLDGEGEVLVELGTRTVATSAITLPDGKTIVAGVTDGNFFAARFVAPRPSAFDFDADGRADIAVFRASTGEWYSVNSAASTSTVRFGRDGDKLVPADFDGDGQTDRAVYRSGIWFILRSSDNQTSVLQFGLGGDVPVAADYDGDNRADAAVFRPSEGTWYILRSKDAQVEITRFGLAEDRPTVGDFDGDGKNDIAVFRPSTGVWYRIGSRDGAIFIRQFGSAGDVPVAADYDGDGRADLAVYRGG